MESSNNPKKKYFKDNKFRYDLFPLVIVLIEF